MSKGGTRAIDALRRSGATFTVHEYEAAASDSSYGEAVAAALGVSPDRAFKTLVAQVDGEPAVAIVPVSGRLSLKKLARALGGKRAEMADGSVAERLTGYVVGGISPFGLRRRLPTLLDRSAAGHETIYVSGGRRGLQLEMPPDALLDASAATLADLAD